MSESNQNNLIFNWESSIDPLAPLNTFQRNIILDFCQEIKDSGPFGLTEAEKETEETDSIDPNDKTTSCTGISSSKKFLEWYTSKENEWFESEDEDYTNYLKTLEKQRNECDGLISQVEACLKNLKGLSHEYLQVSDKTNSLHQLSEHLLLDQSGLCDIRDGISDRLKHFEGVDNLSNLLDRGMLTLHSPNLPAILDTLNEHIDYHANHTNYKESWTYATRYNQLLGRILSLLVNQIKTGFQSAAQQISAASSTHYAKFHAAAHNVKPLINLIESRMSVSSRYMDTLTELQESYVMVREALIEPSVESVINDIVNNNNRKDHCQIIRSACTFLIHLSMDEHSLYHQFFSTPSEIFTKYLESLCTVMYDTTRPIIIHMKHLESLAELCSILRLEMLQEQVNNHSEALAGFGLIAEQLLADVQERLVFRALMYLRTDIAQYKPSPGDLAYPEKLHMMQSIAQSLHEQEMISLTRSDSRTSLHSLGSASSQEISRAHQPSGSPADLHGMWYPPVRRTLLCLSKLYRCVERPTFQGISQEALSHCIQSIADAARMISSNKSALDGEMFQIKHLLILREQIAPFQVDFTVKETSLDFSKMKNAAFQLLNRKTRLFSLSSNNALLEFLLEGSPEVREQWLDSRKDVDKNLKASCESFIQHATTFLMGPFLQTLEKIENYSDAEVKLHKQEWAAPQILCQLVLSTTKRIKGNLPKLQSKMQLYLANRDTEFILYRPIKNNVVGCFTRLNQSLVKEEYSTEEMIHVGCPTPEQVSILLSSASLSVDHPASHSQPTKESEATKSGDKPGDTVSKVTRTEGRKSQDPLPPLKEDQEHPAKTEPLLPPPSETSHEEVPPQNQS